MRDIHRQRLIHHIYIYIYIVSIYPQFGLVRVIHTLSRHDDLLLPSAGSLIIIVSGFGKAIISLVPSLSLAIAALR
ncbi:uncharacterized protein EI90DRAFT_3085784 [Cantharellus anzutake]|uniref:uncharacterized protein n=1 Tax=Cantharellus anzutake TaxID=1750568 RepID=UPI001906DCC8|nr:uncharacterized protein EI90DRAFT_3085784 [Cantharellus anzutake]KAF8316957.1 hypothetical protein EI90DRAFT_3085784 [Cantharellus anzutake]